MPAPALYARESDDKDTAKNVKINILRNFFMPVIHTSTPQPSADGLFIRNQRTYQGLHLLGFLRECPLDCGKPIVR